jgi:hypothetical protein
MEGIQDFEKRLQTLTPKERQYFSIMRAKSGVLKISAKPGVAKSAIARSIAKKMGFQYKDIRLTMIDETDLGMYPDKSEIEFKNKKGEMEKVKVLDFIVPKWAFESNLQPTIIHFEELNRANLHVRNAALRILLERQISDDFAFNDNVLMMCSGNLGEEDNTDVEEFDSALNNRLIHVNHKLSVPEWIDGFAREHVHPTIVNYIETNPEQIYKISDNSEAYATPRSWTFLSDFIITNFGKDSSPSDFISTVKEIAMCYVGNSAIKFIKYCEDMMSLTINDVIKDYKSVKDKVLKSNRDKRSELIQSLRSIDVMDLSDKEIGNVKDFLKTVTDEERVAYLLFVIDCIGDKTKPKYTFDNDKLVNLLVEFKPDLTFAKGVIDNV